MKHGFSDGIEKTTEIFWRDKGVVRKGAAGDTKPWHICSIILMFIIEIMTVSYQGQSGR